VVLRTAITRANDCRRPEGKAKDGWRPDGWRAADRAQRVDRGRSALDALETIADFKRRKISLWLLDLGGDCSGNAISELVLTVAIDRGQTVAGSSRATRKTSTDWTISSACSVSGVGFSFSVMAHLKPVQSVSEQGKHPTKPPMTNRSNQRKSSWN
jgi:hypothetical protein